MGTQEKQHVAQRHEEGSSQETIDVQVNQVTLVLIFILLFILQSSYLYFFLLISIFFHFNVFWALNPCFVIDSSFVSKFNLGVKLGFLLLSVVMISFGVKLGFFFL